MVGRKVITDTVKDLILQGSPPLFPGCGPILTETPTFKLWLVSTVVPIVQSTGILILSSLTHPCVTALGEDLEPAGVRGSHPRYPSSLPALHADHPNIWLVPTNDPTLASLASVSVSPVPTQGLQLGSTLLLPLTSLDLPRHRATS